MDMSAFIKTLMTTGFFKSDLVLQEKRVMIYSVMRLVSLMMGQSLQLDHREMMAMDQIVVRSKSSRFRLLMLMRLDL